MEKNMNAIELHLAPDVTVSMAAEDGFILEYFLRFATILDRPVHPNVSISGDPTVKLLFCDKLPPPPQSGRWQMTLANRCMHVEGGGSPLAPHGPFYFYLPPQAEQFLKHTPGFQYALYLQALLFDFLNQTSALLTHGALAVRGFQAILCTGPSGSGKSTLMQRLPSPWFSPADDLMLLLEKEGKIYIHPLPTWSQWYNNGKPLTRPICHLEKIYQLSGVAVLARGEQDCCCDLSRPEAVQAINSAFVDGTKMLRWLLPKLDLKPLFHKGFEQSFQILQNYPVKKFKLQKTTSSCLLFEQVAKEWQLNDSQSA